MWRAIALFLLSAFFFLSCCKEPESSRGSSADSGSLPPVTASAPPGSTKAETVKEEEEAETLREELEQLEKKRKELGDNFLSANVGPFLILANCSEAEFERIKKWTIRDCMDAFNKDFFETKPTHRYTVYLFKDDRTYRHFAKKLWNDTDISKFGYYKPSIKALVVNIDTGTGTLVHEMVHALMEADFPDSPAWFNEGMGSLFEHCRIEENERGHIHGLMNWRFPALREALEKGKIAPLSEVLATSRSQFYGERREHYYAMARYLCMFGQQKGVLPKFYKKFRDNYKEDPTGKKFLEEVFGKKLEEIEKDWHAWLKEQKYPPDE
jgi:hypothetical protein